MKTFLLALIICVSVTISTQAQINAPHNYENEATAMISTKTNEEPTKTLKADVMNREARFPGGMKAMKTFLAKNIKYSKIAQENCFEGTVMVKFAVNPDGSLTDIQVIKSDNPMLNDQAMNIVKKMPNWEAAVNGGYYITRKIIVPIQFSLR